MCNSENGANKVVYVYGLGNELKLRRVCEGFQQKGGEEGKNAATNCNKTLQVCYDLSLLLT